MVFSLGIRTGNIVVAFVGPKIDDFSTLGKLYRLLSRIFKISSTSDSSARSSTTASASEAKDQIGNLEAAHGLPKPKLREIGTHVKRGQRDGDRKKEESFTGIKCGYESGNTIYDNFFSWPSKDWKHHSCSEEKLYWFKNRKRQEKPSTGSLLEDVVGMNTILHFTMNGRWIALALPRPIDVKRQSTL